MIVLIPIGVFPSWPHGRAWGYGPNRLLDATPQRSPTPTRDAARAAILEGTHVLSAIEDTRTGTQLLPPRVRRRTCRRGRSAPRCRRVSASGAGKRSNHRLRAGDAPAGRFRVRFEDACADVRCQDRQRQPRTVRGNGCKARGRRRTRGGHDPVRRARDAGPHAGEHVLRGICRGRRRQVLGRVHRRYAVRRRHRAHRPARSRENR